MTPQKLAKQEGLKDAMKELKKLTSFQDKLAHGAKPKGAAEPWAVQVCRFCGAGRNEGGSERGGDGIYGIYRRKKVTKTEHLQIPLVGLEPTIPGLGDQCLIH